MEQIQHFSHKHPLTLSKLKDDDFSDEEISRCRGCTLKILPGSTFYTCDKKCRHPFSLHKACAELPRELEHYHKHPYHTLVLYSHPQTEHFSYTCESCGNGGREGFIYQCSHPYCRFTLDVICAFSDQPNETNTIQHGSHPQHPLVLLTRPVHLLCDACYDYHKGHFYMCNACNFYIHQDCASFPITIKHSSHHVHPLTLSYSLPIDLKYMPWMRDACGVCLWHHIYWKEIHRLEWQYYCRTCQYHVHLRCAIKRHRSDRDKEEKMSKTIQLTIDRDNSNVIRLPLVNEFESVVGNLITSANSEDDVGSSSQLPSALTEVNQLISHEHPLVLLENHESFLDTSSNSLRRVPEYSCDVCFRAVSPPFYHCKICDDLFLHEKCLKLPSKIHHPFHPKHPLILFPHSPEPFNLFCCGVCLQLSNGICFHCSTCQISLDIKCALLPMRIIHDAHPRHVLVLKNHLPRLKRINCCEDSWFLNFRCAYQCVECDFGLHGHCALFPSTVHDRCDKHPLKLIVDPSQGNSDEYYCQICETQINQKYWFYHCFDCDVSFHIRCKPPEDHHPIFHITGFPSLAYHSNLKFGRTFTSHCHPDHPLTVVQHLQGSSCSICGQHIYSGRTGLALECSHCNFVIHFWCCGELPMRPGQPWRVSPNDTKPYICVKKANLELTFPA